MKVKILAGLVTALIYGNAAWAQDVSEDAKQGDTQQSPDNIGGSGLADPNADDILILEEEDVAPPPEEQGVGGSGDVGTTGEAGRPCPETYGGSGQMGQGQQQMQPGIPMQGQGGVTLFCTPVQPQPTGGSGEVQEGTGISEDEQSSLQREYDVEVGEAPPAPVPVPVPEQEAIGGAGYEEKKEPEANIRGLTVMIGGGVEGYTDRLASEVNPGPAVGVMAALRPSSVLGLELAYSGAVNNFDVPSGGDGPDVVRNGGQAALTLGLTATPVQPYVLGGFGVNWYNVRHGFGQGYLDDTSTNLPVGVGLRTHVGDFTADARINYSFLFSQDFAPEVDNNASTGRYNGSINIGGTF